MCSPEATIELVAGVVKAVRIPVTVKMRLGWDSQTLSAPYFARAFEDVGVAAVTVHGRTRAQGFKGSVDRDGIRAVASAVQQIPVFGNGDIRSVEDALAMFEETGCTGIAIGRGALLNPWIFTQLVQYERTGENPSAATNGEHLDFMVKHFTSLVALRGERFGCLSFRKMAAWYGKAIPMGKPLQVRLATVSNTSEFTETVAELREKLGPLLREPFRIEDRVIKVPNGPNERW
jgi:nifR3 family TIM-barrel protein